MTRYKLEIEQDSTGTWVGTSNLGLEEEKAAYIPHNLIGICFFTSLRMTGDALHRDQESLEA